MECGPFADDYVPFTQTFYGWTSAIVIPFKKPVAG
jgi:hypothetical protein